MNRQKYALKPEHVVKYLDSYMGTMDEQAVRNQVLNLLVDKIYLYDDKVVVNCFFSEDAREIRFNEFDEHIANLEKINNMLDNSDTNSYAMPKSLEKLIGNIETDESNTEAVIEDGQHFFG